MSLVKVRLRGGIIMKKKLITLIVATTMVLSLVGCGNKAGGDTTKNDNDVVFNQDDVEAPAEDIAAPADDFDAPAEDVAAPEVDGYATLEDYYSVQENYDVLMNDIQEVYNSSSDMYSNITFNVLGNVITYGYYYAIEVDDSTADANIDAYFEELDDSTWDEVRRSVISNSGITDTITVAYEYYNIDGELIAEYSKDIY